MNKQQALKTIVKAIKRPDHMKEAREYGQTWYLTRHPFDPSRDDLVDFIGFSSDDIYPLLYHALAGGYGPVTGLTFWLCPQKEIAGGHQIFAEVRTETTVYLTCGMTDYSGSGGHAYKELKNAFEFLAEIYGLAVEYRELAAGADEQAFTLINRQIKEQMAEEETDNVAS
jgi:hypothetical protein